MTNQEKKQQLQRYVLLGKKIGRAEAEKRKWQALSMDADSACAAMLAMELGADIRQMALLRLELKRALASIGDDQLELLMTLRYIDGLTWEQVAERMHMDCRWVQRLHKKALDRLTMESPCPPVV